MKLVLLVNFPTSALMLGMSQSGTDPEGLSIVKLPDLTRGCGAVGLSSAWTGLLELTEHFPDSSFSAMVLVWLFLLEGDLTLFLWFELFDVRFWPVDADILVMCSLGICGSDLLTRFFPVLIPSGLSLELLVGTWWFFTQFVTNFCFVSFSSLTDTISISLLFEFDFVF